MKTIKRKLVMLLAVVASFCSSIVVFAESGGGTANQNVVTSMTSLANDMVATGNAIVPIALTVVGIGLVVTFGVRIFRRIAKP